SLLSVRKATCLIRWVRHGANVRYQRSYVTFGKSVSPRWHQRRFVQCRTAVADDGNQVRVANLVERLAFREGMRLHRQIVHVRDPLWRGLRVMAAHAILRVEL